MADLIRFRVNGSLDLVGEVSRIAVLFGFGSEVKVSRIKAGVMTYKYHLSSAMGDWIVRFYPVGRSDVVRFEPDLLIRLRAEGVPVPEVIGDSRCDDLALLEYVVYKKIIGSPLSEKITSLNDRELGFLSGQISRTLSTVAGVSTRGWGEMINSSMGASESWGTFVCEQYREAMLNEAVNHELGSEVLDKFRCSFDFLHGLIAQPTTAALVLGDLSPENIILSEAGELIGFVDVEGALSVEPALSLGYLYAREPNSRFCKFLMAAWPDFDRVQSDKVEFYSLIRMLRLLKYVGEPLPTGGKRLPIKDFLPGAMAVVNKYS